MTIFSPALRLPTPSRKAWIVAAFAGAALVVVAWQALFAQVAGDRGIAAVASSTDISIGGIEVNVTGKNSEDARKNGYVLAQRLGWEKLGGPKVSDGELDSMVSAIVIEHEQIGPRRYIARLGIVFDRTKAGAMLGAGGPQAHSAPMLTIPVLKSGGTYTVYEVRNAWQRAWAEYQAGGSAIDYVRPSGSGGDSLLINYGQVGRRSRVWWRNVLDAFGAADVLIPVADLERQWPGGPVKGTFTARYGPDNAFLETFTLTAPNEQGVPDMLVKAIQRFDAIYTAALGRGLLQPDPTLRADRIQLNPTIAALIAAERNAQNADAAAAAADAADDDTVETAPTPVPTAQPTAQPAAASYVVQFNSPSAGSVDSALAAVRGVPGVRGAATSSIAIGGVSVMRVTYSGDLGALAAALRAKGWNVAQNAGGLGISK
ncbi:MAG: heavy-metal-associated domain-containing protein [Candidatus Andeanibacterium colombiense]|uniref:Heavy-metal-associated domain-containing protein n=1 Tax=Candidatus Andeanibacterium colombiense TaxID=3121345 RepID=A0AAJ6BPQ0_9SPHN|nr:MAG: heavy-metal-associated domain-containing protein [Sphingomonadaceae bacterium]